MSALPLPDLSRCAEEPIRIPGAIQPHGRMAVLHAHDGRLLAHSANWPSADAAREALRIVPVDAARLQPGESPAWIGTVAIDGQTFDVGAHRLGDTLVVEYEPAGAAASMHAPIYTVARELLPRLQQADSVAALCHVVAREMKRLTGYGRCLIYRFDSDGHGEVLAERADAGYQSYAGHRFPASDVPQQARDLYRVNHIRVIPDANYEPVPLVPADASVDAGTFDLSFAALRSVSPVHLEYMRNMGTSASMSVSIVARGRLWGLISCHNHEAKPLPFQTRVACEHLGRLLSLQIQAQEDNADVTQRLALHQRVLRLVAMMAESDGTLQQLVAPDHLLHGLADAAGAAVVLNNSCWTTGQTPEPDAVRNLAHWIVERGQDLFSTDRLPDVYPEGKALLPGCAGVLAVSISQVHRHVVLWFRPEVVQTIQWAGDPRKTQLPSDGRIHPRRSFDSWQERVRGRSAPWLVAQLAAVMELRQALLALVLRRAEELAGHAIELGRVNRELEAFSYTVSHDLRAPMRHIAGYVDLVIDDNPQLDERALRYLNHVKGAASYAGELVDALLDFSRLGRSGLRPTWVETGPLVKDLLEEIRQQEKDRVIEWDLQAPLPRVWADPLLLQVALRNLLSNAAKYTRHRETAQVRVAAVSQPGGVGLEIQDNGAGFPMKYVGKLFGVFQRLHRTEDFAGTGIGLANVKRIVERHGGSVWARGEPDHGATFGFILPPAPTSGNDAASVARNEERS